MTLDPALHAAAVTAAGPAPTDDLTPWLARVGTIYESLHAQRRTLDAQLELIARIEAPKETRERGCGIVTGTLMNVREEHGRAVIELDADMGSEDYGLDVFRTPWLDDGGQALADTARALEGRRVRVWKYAEAHSKKPGQTVRMVAKIEAAAEVATVPAQATDRHLASVPADAFDEAF
jgi:hypothetical protein